ncbi:PDZ domain-containing protein [Anaeromyxobacter oryzae]|uniref:PDZ domain-containing protein n=1 Tax=Anaeromyxobacter oryzae TaxID=2918170 RepID=A0ABM7WSN5_9BACT|nr:hypothetical protein [Anaeromyxobacter oryzae]BDG02472.1 hypothetical protein AMOR_14680 [Anaeromyxobacter oryzae]
MLRALARRTALPALALALAVAGCASGPRVLVRRRPAGPVAVRAVAVYPYAFRWPEPAWKSHAKALDAAMRLSAQDRLLVFGPDDFRVWRPEADDPRVGTDLVGVLADRRLPATGFVVFRGWAERRIVRTAGELDGKGVVSSAEQVTYVAHLEVLDGGGRGVLVEVEGEATRDAATVDAFDDAPELTRLHRALVDEAWRVLAARLPGDAPPLPPVPARVIVVPGATLAWTEPGRPSLAEQLAAADPVEADVARLAVFRYFDPDVDGRALARRMRLPGGLLVVDGGAWAPPLREGDVIVAVDGRAAAGPHVLQRAVALARGGPVELTVARGAVRVPVTVMPR